MEEHYWYGKDNIQKAWFAIEKAILHFRALGFSVSDPLDPAANGCDLSIWRPNPAGAELPPLMSAQVEVKFVGFSQRAWRAQGRHMRTGDDFIAYVFPSGHVWVEDFASHEKLRNRGGIRHLTMIAKLFGVQAEAI